MHDTYTTAFSHLISEKEAVGNRKALMAHLIDHEEGPFAKVLADVE